MTETYVTQCPHCGTTFKVNQVHLSAANGSVRCGACLQIFKAMDHLSGKKTASATIIKHEGAALRSPGSGEHPQQGTGIHRAQTQFSKPKQTFSARDADDFEYRQPNSPDDFGFGELSEDFNSVKNKNSDTQNSRKEPKISDFDEAESELESKFSENKSSSNKPQLASRTQSTELRGTDDNQDDNDIPDYLDGHVDLDKPEPLKIMVDNIEAPPHDFENQGAGSSRNLLSWAFLSLLLGVLAIGQIAWYQLPNWSQLNSLRPWYQQLCQLAGCELAVQQDTQRIRSGNLVVRKDIKNPGALAIDAIIINQAPYQQPFPEIILEFTDLTGKLIADGEFKPTQYLGGELTGENSMSPRTPVHISFSVNDPGTNAVNYQIRFR